MDYRILLSLVILLLIETLKATTNYVEDYCWRDYRGVIPSDALQGGLDKSGKPTYIGQALFEGKLIPGRIQEGDDKVYFEWKRKEHGISKNVKILCSNQPQKFEWINTTNNQTSYLTNQILINGGFEPGHSTYIGRALSNGETLVGKVICSTDSCFGLYTTSNKSRHLHRIFQILIYNQQTPNVDVNCKPDIDIRID